MGLAQKLNLANSAASQGADGAHDDRAKTGQRSLFHSFKRSQADQPSSHKMTTDIPIPGAPNPDQDPAAYLRSIHAVREQAKLVYEKLLKNELKHFDVDMARMEDVASYVVAIIKRDYAPNFSTIPPHGRWQHYFEDDRSRLDDLLASWPKDLDAYERTRRILDLFFVSVLVDAGAGNKWKYKSTKTQKVFNRSEGLAIAALEMLETGLFSDDPSQPFQVNGPTLKKLQVDAMAKGFQVTESNPMDGLEGRSNLLRQLGTALDNETYFGESKRPGNILDYLVKHSAKSKAGSPIVAVPIFWDALMDGLKPVWPATRTKLNGVSLGDAWPCSALPKDPQQEWKSIVPFHKLTQWLAYSLIVPMEKIAKLKFVGMDLMTGLPEYRNGGIFVDAGLLTLKKDDVSRGLDNYHKNSALPGAPNVEVVPAFFPDDDVIVEWRVATVGLLDHLLKEANKVMASNGADPLNLPQLLEAGSWKGGREIAEVSRPNTKGPPIMIISDGTVF